MPRHQATTAKIHDPVRGGRPDGSVTTVALTGPRITTPLHDTQYRAGPAEHRRQPALHPGYFYGNNMPTSPRPGVRTA
ncbi:hypothetical protein ACOT81_07170 [Streptomyces sp. WI04-05B]|uniref:hypothetical protein n=1 Tax=Streptomyces TaxID=1883 RepID=UPI0029A79F9B|nr:MULTISPECIES: hypothetical protein [unclassified Streptomyces]MDX2549075.1 hypothetical protein [Streptomyces sp. WI04-05B]MDX2590484.1 hypothetical protein [Streptomyces sp. WI04-05A]